MDFGRVPEDELAKIDFNLATEPAFNKTVLPGKPVKDPKIYIGCAKWGRTEWLGKIYPPKAKEKDFLVALSKDWSEEIEKKLKDALLSYNEAHKHNV